ncbi:MAG: glycosyltransferase family 39 protein [Candidatus Magasanikbacteria bacterium]|nr:glycosyltransferase family 39 protein [Candidatus Magasanikbacteria bacterium]
MIRKTRNILSIILLALLWGAIVFVIGVGGDFPLNDDWVHAWSVKNLLNARGLQLLPYAGPLLYVQVLLGAAASAVFGFSFVTLRFVTLACALVALWSLWSIVRQARVSAKNAFLVVLALAVNPWFVNLSFTFMTDVPALAFLLLAAALMIKGYKGDQRGWMILANLAALASMFIRQSGALFFVAVIVAIALNIRKPAARRALPITIIFAAIGGGLYWFLGQRGLLPGTAGVHFLGWRALLPHALEWLAYSVLYLGLLALPVFAGVALARRKIFLRGKTMLWFLAIGAVVAYFWIARGQYFPYVGNIITHAGLGPTGEVLQGTESAMFPLWMWWIATALATIGAALMVRFHVRAKLRMLRKWHFPFDVTLVGALFGLQIALVLVVKGFDRYLLPALAFLLAYVALYYGKKFRMKRWVVALGIVALAAYSIIGTQNYLRWNQVRWSLTYPFSHTHSEIDIDAGYEWCGWAVYTERGYTPADELSVGENPHDRSKPWYVNSICPADTGAYVVSFSELPGYEVFLKTEYKSWYDTSPWLYVLKKK